MPKIMIQNVIIVMYRHHTKLSMLPSAAYKTLVTRYGNNDPALWVKNLKYIIRSSAHIKTTWTKSFYRQQVMH